MVNSAIKRLRDVKTGQWTSFQYANDELKHILSSTTQTVDGVTKSLKVLEQWSDYKPLDEHTVHAVFTIEGGHTISYGRNEKEDINKMLANLKHFRAACPLFFHDGSYAADEFRKSCLWDKRGR
ncbi:MAG: hypothetical protein IPH20_07535 [Bacteroidales bacterium]|nr:hypothetical protein [Bacteroidales bacterium]